MWIPADVPGTGPGHRRYMGNKTIVGYDGTDLARDVLALAQLLARAWGPLGRVLLGSVSSQLVRSAPCPLLVFPRGAKGPPDVTRATAEAVGVR